MSADLDLGESDELLVFPARTVRTHLGMEGNPIAVYRETLKWGQNRLYEMFREGTPAASLVRARADLVDEVLRCAWERFLPSEAKDIALVAVGGYGRSELLPHSDVDLLVLHQGKALKTHQQALEQLLTFFWDIGLEIGSSVRTVEECVSLAGSDLTIATNLLEARLLCGSQPLFSSFSSELNNSSAWNTADFFTAKRDEQEKRHQKYDGTGYKLEPNVKEGPGGLRDIQTIAWVAKRKFGATTLSELGSRGFLTKQECDELFAGQDFLWRVRFALHMLTDRREDRLLFDHQVKIAELFGYLDQDHNLAVEQFMQLYYRTIKVLSCLNDILLQLFEQAILGTQDTQNAKRLNARFVTHDGFIEASAEDIFRRHPHALIEVFLMLQRHPEIKGIGAKTLRLIRRDRRLVDEGLRSNVHARDLFMQMFRQGTGLTRALRRMNRYGVLGRFLPTFGDIIGRMQYDLFHTLTVDEHSLYVVRNLRRFALPRFAQELPFCNEIMLRIEKPELLYIAGLFHDMGKGRGGDHSEIGSEDATKFGLEYGLSHTDTELVSWLVKNHLLMSLTAQRMDISDPKIVGDFCEKVGSRKRLDYLLLLTCADIRATNPELWNSWRESLLFGLYRSSVRAMERGLDNPLQVKDLVSEIQRKTLSTFSGDSGAIKTMWQRFNDDYFLRHTEEELLWHAQAILGASEADLPLVLSSTLETGGCTVFIYMHDREHLFALSTSALAQLGLSILDARINTTDDGFTLDSYTLSEEDGTPVAKDQRQQEVAQSLQQILRKDNTEFVPVSRRLSRKLKHFNTPTNVFFKQDEDRNQTVIELVTADQPGLLSLVGRVFQKRGILVTAAKVATIGERAEDVFFVTDSNGNAITDSEQLVQLRSVLSRTLNGFDANSKIKAA